ncbi:transposase [Streptomyces sp. NPDC015171]|uniref:transposase n=1 Tax=Streptomyces sp. NPDC015171 TaxID=3364945 RepID=UPI0036F4FFEE
MARQYCGAVGKRANCQVGINVHAATDTVVPPCSGRCICRARGRTSRTDAAGRIPDDVVHREKWRLALGLLDTLAQWQRE